MPNLKNLTDYLTKNFADWAPKAVQKKPGGGTKITSLGEAQKEQAAQTIQKAWARHRFHTDFSQNAHTVYVDMHTDDTDRILSHLMFGKTKSTFKKERHPYLPINPYIAQKVTSEIGYYRTDPLYALENMKDIIKHYDPHANHSQYDYIPITESALFSTEELIKDYAPHFNKNNLKILRQPESSLALIRISKNDGRFFLLKKFFTTLGLFSGTFYSKIVGVGIKSSYWQIAKHKQMKLPEREKAGLGRLEQYLPDNVTDLKKDNRFAQLSTLAHDTQTPTQQIAAAFLGLIEHLPEDSSLNKEAVKRIALFMELATTFCPYDYDKFAFFLYCVIHELSLLLNKKELIINYEQFKQTTTANSRQIFKLTPSSKFRYFALPTQSGTNAMIVALDIAKKANKNKTISIQKEGELYYEFDRLNVTKFTTDKADHDVFLLTAGPTVWTGIYPGIDINKVIRHLIEEKRITKPITLIIDTTSGMHRNLKLDPDVQKKVEEGNISLIVNEGHQKFGLAHSDQSQYGYVFGVCNTDAYPHSLIDEYEQAAVNDLQNNLDMQIGTYLTMAALNPLERVKERHFRNGTYFRDFLVEFDMGTTKIERGDRNIDDEECGLFAYISSVSTAARTIKKHLLRRDSFGHFHTTWSDCGPYIRIAPSASDKVDISIEASELYLASKFGTQELISLLSSMVKEELNKKEPISIVEEVVLAGLLQTLLHKKYQPKSLAQQFEWHFALKYMREKCSDLSGRRSYHELLTAQKYYLAQAKAPLFIQQALYKMSKMSFPIAKAEQLFHLIGQYNQLKNNKNQSIGIQAAVILLCSANLNQAKETITTETLFANPALSKTIIALAQHNLLSSKMHSFLAQKTIDPIYYEAIEALIQTDFMKDKTDVRPLELLIKKDKAYAEAVVILHQAEVLWRDLDTRAQSSKPSQLEKRQLYPVLGSIKDFTKALTKDLLEGLSPNFEEQKYKQLLKPAQQYITYAQESRSNIFKKIAIYLRHFCSRIWSLSNTPSPSRTEIKNKLVGLHHRFTTSASVKDKEPEKMNEVIGVKPKT